MSALKVLFFVGTRRGFLLLDAALAAGVRPCGVIVFRQHQHESDRYEDRLRGLAEQHGIPHWETTSLKEIDYPALVNEVIRPDLAVVAGVRVLFPRELIAQIRLGALAVHDSLLPRYRGFAPMNWAIVNGDDVVGTTLFRMAEGLDDGEIVGQVSLALGLQEDAPTLHERLTRASIELVLAAIATAERDGMLPTAKQQGSETRSCSRGPEDGLIDWTWPSRRIHDLVRALCPPYPGAFTYYRNRPVVIVRSEDVVAPPVYEGRVPGRVIGFSLSEGWADVLAGSGIVRIHSILQDQEIVPATSLIRSVRVRLGIDLPELLTRVERLEHQLDLLTRGQRS